MDEQKFLSAQHLIDRLNEMRNDISKVESYSTVADAIALIELACAVCDPKEDGQDELDELESFLL